MHRRTGGKQKEGWGLLKTSWRYQTGEFFDKSTLHGVRYIAEKDRPFCERFIWFCLTSVGTMVTLIIIVSLWEKFQTNPTITGLDTDFHNWEVPFPTVTLCPQDPTNESLIIEYIESTWGNVSALENSELYIAFVKTLALLSVSDLQNILQFSDNSALVSKLPSTNFEDILYKVMSDCSDVLFDCEWKGTPYNCCEGFSAILTEVGFCFTFNSRHSHGGSDNLRVTGEEGEFKPHLIHETDSKWAMIVNILNVEQNNVRVYIHSADEGPSLDLAPQHVWKRTINKIQFSAKHTYTTDDARQLSVRQRHCVFPREVQLLSDTNYTYSTCMVECRMRRAKALCGCVPFFYQEFDTFPHCDLKGLACLAKLNAELTKDLTCSCELGCMNTVYEVDKLNDVVLDSDNSLEIGFVSWPMVRYKREVLFGWVDLLVSFGGIAGLFLGFSLLSGVEIVYYFTMRSCCMLYRNREQLIQLQNEYETQPRPEINLDLKPYFRENPVVERSQPREIFTIPYLN
ncbi:sodium channel protein Nach-like [Homalodisca vitripennis]|uniref:sodium channel protein Nach-like n=1 Tax=Homalodisca vitripennis TaxID=197043 RepID=UPI001EEB1C4A|nr:sodium channel protein Nach-like [Homalodisca vitripennis]